jgi:hypothetical protein
MKESDSIFDFKDIYQDILMRARYSKFEQKLDYKIKFNVPTHIIELMPKDLMMND